MRMIIRYLKSIDKLYVTYYITFSICKCCLDFFDMSTSFHSIERDWVNAHFNTLDNIMWSTEYGDTMNVPYQIFLILKPFIILQVLHKQRLLGAVVYIGDKKLVLIKDNIILIALVR